MPLLDHKNHRFRWRGFFLPLCPCCGGGTGDFDTPWGGHVNFNVKVFLQSGQFTSTIKTSQSVSASNCDGLSWDGTNTPIIDGDPSAPATTAILISGQFSTTIKQNQSFSGSDDGGSGVSWDGTNTPWSNSQTDKLLLQSGQFTSTVKTSRDISAVSTNPLGISYSNGDTPWCEGAGDKFLLQSGQFSSTIKTSVDLSSLYGTDSPGDISWDGINTLSTRTLSGSRRLMLFSGQFTSTIKTSESIESLGKFPLGINTNNLIVG